MSYKFLRCRNPNHHHIKIVYGNLLEQYLSLHCECGYKFDLPQDNFKDIIDMCDIFEDIKTEEETKVLPLVQIKI